MSKLIKFSAFLVVTSVAFAFTLNNSTSDDKKYGYVGAEKCGMCHKSDKQGKQLSIWQGSKHAGAYKTLQSQKADEIAKAKGSKTKAVETKACLKCHSSGSDVDAALKGPKFKVEDGVQCETCHGPGSDYQQMSVMKNQEQAIAKGLIVPKDIEKFCKGCHNSESPTFKSFNFVESWNKIKHDIPKAK
jgi:cytochrome c2